MLYVGLGPTCNMQFFNRRFYECLLGPFYAVSSLIFCLYHLSLIECSKLRYPVVNILQSIVSLGLLFALCNYILLTYYI